MAGRPPAANIARTVTIRLRATPAEADAWRAEAQRRGVSFSDLVRLALASEVPREDERAG